MVVERDDVDYLRCNSVKEGGLQERDVREGGGPSLQTL
jgi:hypothetical protein